MRTLFLGTIFLGTLFLVTLFFLFLFFALSCFERLPRERLKAILDVPYQRHCQKLCLTSKEHKMGIRCCGKSPGLVVKGGDL